MNLICYKFLNNTLIREKQNLIVTIQHFELLHRGQAIGGSKLQVSLLIQEVKQRTEFAKLAAKSASITDSLANLEQHFQNNYIIHSNEKTEKCNFYTFDLSLNSIPIVQQSN